MNKIIERLRNPIAKLRSGAQFRVVYDKGQRFHSPYFSVFILPTGTDEIRLGITVTRKVGKAVVRNRCKRRLREIFRTHQQDIIVGMGYDLVVNAKAELATAPFALVEDAFLRTFRRFQAFLQKRSHAAALLTDIGENRKP